MSGVPVSTRLPDADRVALFALADRRGERPADTLRALVREAIRPADPATTASAADRVREACAARDEAVERVERHADSRWLEAAYTVVLRLARTRAEFTTDDVWSFGPGVADLGRPREPRALGAVMNRARKAGLVEPTDRTVPSTRPDAHRNPKRVWRSLVAEEARR